MTGGVSVFSRNSFSNTSFSPTSWHSTDIVIPMSVAPSFPAWEITEQASRASHGMLHQALDRRRATRRGW